MGPCFECGQPADVDHHVVPRSLGGTKTVPLCDGCHTKIHGCGMRTSHLTKQAMARLKREGKRIGQIPYGMGLAANGTLQPVPEEMAVIDHMMYRRSQGANYSQISYRLNDREIRSRRGKLWSPKVVRDIIRRVNGERRSAAQ